MKSNELVKYRTYLGQSQGSLANLLGTSLRSVQSYEQGWREIPPNVERMLLYLTYQKRLGRNSQVSCWKVKKCPVDWRDNCAAYQLQANGPCWFMNGTFCEGRKQNNWNKKIGTCRTCIVFTRIMKDKDHQPPGQH